MKNKIKGKLSSKKAVGNKMSEDEYTVHAFKFLVAVNRRFPQASKFEMEKDSKDFLRHAPARVKQDAARAEKEEAAKEWKEQSRGY
jgi:hypothetical protein